MTDGTAQGFKDEAVQRRDALLGLPAPSLAERFGSDLVGMPGASLTSETLHAATTLLERARIAHARAVYRDAVMGNRRRIPLLAHGASQNAGHLNRCFDLSK
jgi:hypothetical protein